MDSAVLAFRIESVNNGTLTLNGSPVVPGVTIFSSGQTLVWTPTGNASGNVTAFQVSAWDGFAASANSVAVSTPVFANPAAAPLLAQVDFSNGLLKKNTEP